MANIKTHLNNIKGALYGKDVRGSIHDGIDAINKEVENTTGRQVDLENTFDQLVINAGNSNAEIVDARVGQDGKSYSKLGDRLDDFTSQLAQKANKHDSISILQIDKNLGKLDQTYMTDEFLQQIAGNTPINSVVADNSITEIKLADKSLTTRKFSDESMNYIKGGISVKNIVSIGNMDDSVHWNIKGGGNVSANNNILSFTPASWNSNIAINNGIIPIPSKESVYYVGVFVKGNSSGNKIVLTTLEGDLDGCFLGDDYKNNNLYSFNITVLPTNTGLTLKVINYSDIYEPIEISKLVVINLSESYGYGKEPDPDYIKNKILRHTNNNFYINFGENIFIDKWNVLEQPITESMVDYKFKEKLNKRISKFIVNAKNNDYCEIISKYANDEYLSILFKRTGNNNIFNFKHIHILNDDFTVKRYLADLGTDWFGPYAMTTINNIDGDQVGSWFTGGNHAYKDSTGTPTGRTLNVNIYCDNVLVDNKDNEYNCNEIKIVWTNRIQAMNTIKEDGTGREVLEETYTLIINELGVINVENKIIALEDIIIKDFYCLQHTNSGWITNTYYVTDDNKKMLSNAIDTESGSLGTSTSKISMSTTDVIEFGIDTTIGVGLENKITPSIFSRGGKSYCNAIKNKTIYEGDINVVKGLYKLYHL